MTAHRAPGECDNGALTVMTRAQAFEGLRNNLELTTGRAARLLPDARPGGGRSD